MRAFVGAAGPPRRWLRDPAGAVAAYLGALATCGRARKTLLNHQTAVRGFLAHLAARGIVGGGPLPRVPMARAHEPAPRYLRTDELDETIRLAGELGIGPEVGLALATGLRLGELIRLRWDDVDTARRTLLVRRAKGRRPRAVPLSAAGIAALEDQRRVLAARGAEAIGWVFPARQTWRGGWRFKNSPRTRNWWKRAIEPIRRAIPRFTEDAAGCRTGRGWHLLRHTFASRLAQDGVSLYKIAQWLGHRDVRTTQIYAHLQQGYDPDIERAAASGPERTGG